MDLWQVPFSLRLGAVVMFLAVASAVELAIRGRAATRWRDSLFIAGVAVLCGIFGAAVDAVTSSISAEYFSLGKGLGFGSGLRGRAIELGMKAGVSAGVLIACIYVVVRRTGQLPAASGTVMLSALHLPLVGALVFGLLGFAIGSCFAPAQDALAVVSVTDARSFSLVWLIHSGLYLGGWLGTAGGVVRISRRRRAARDSASR